MGTEHFGSNWIYLAEIYQIHSYHEQKVECTDCKNVQLDYKSVHVNCLER
jgi:ribosomal protein S27E